MDHPSPKEIASLVESGRAWIRAQRNHYRLHAQAIPPDFFKAIPPLFSAALLAKARWWSVDSIPIPPFDAQAKALGLDLSQAEGITFDDTFLITRAAAGTLGAGLVIFHELVHVAQYSVLGVDDFVTQYVDGLVTTRDYYNVPLEKMAYDLQARYATDMMEGFPVEDLVRRALQPPER